MNNLRFVVYLIVFIGFSQSFAADSDGFITAIRLDNAYAVKRAVEQGQDPNVRNNEGLTALSLALKEDSFAAAEALLGSPDVDVNVLNAQRESPLMLAALKGQVALCQRMLQHGAQVNLPGWSPLHYAASGPSLDATRLLLKSGASLEAESPNKTTPLMMAAGYGSISTAQWLLAQGADPRRRNEAGLNAADFARKAGRDTLATQLLASSAAASAPSVHPVTPP